MSKDAQVIFGWRFTWALGWGCRCLLQGFRWKSGSLGTAEFTDTPPTRATVVFTILNCELSCASLTRFAVFICHPVRLFNWPELSSSSRRSGTDGIILRLPEVLRTGDLVHLGVFESREHLRQGYDSRLGNLSYHTFGGRRAPDRRRIKSISNRSGEIPYEVSTPNFGADLMVPPEWQLGRGGALQAEHL